MIKLGIFSTHPIQYQVPLWRHLTRNESLDVRVFYFSEQGVAATKDPGFGQIVKWDTPLLDGYHSTFLSKQPIQNANHFNIANVKDFLAKNRFDAVLLHGYMNRFARQLLVRKRKFGFKVLLRGEFSEMRRRSLDWKRPLRELYLKWFYHRVDHFCPIGMDAIKHLKNRGIPAERMTLTPYSVDDQLFEQQNLNLDKTLCRQKLGIQSSDKAILFSGKMIPRKQPLLLAESILQLSKDYPQLTAIFLGSGPQFEELTQRLKPVLGNRFIAPGFVNQSELGTYFKASDLFVLPSTFDTWGLVVNEAMHFGLPCVVSDMVGSSRDLITPGETGMVFRYDSPQELTACLRRFLDDPHLSTLMGEKAHRLIQNYTIAKTAAGIESAIAKATATSTIA